MKALGIVAAVLATLVGIGWLFFQSLFGQLSEPVDKFFSGWNGGNPSVLREVLSDDFIRNTPYEALAKFMREHRLDQVVATSWNNSNIHNQVGKLSGTLTRRDGSMTMATITLLKYSEHWKIQHIHIGTPTNQPNQPTGSNPVIASNQTQQYNPASAWTRSSDASRTDTDSAADGSLVGLSAQ